MKNLLVCISHHHSPERFVYLQAVLNAFAEEYKLSHDIIVDTDVTDLPDLALSNLTIVSHVSLEHPFHLAWQHRKHMRDHIDEYEWFLYLENDLHLAFENFRRYQQNFGRLWPNYVPSFLRVETMNGDEFAVDVTTPQPLSRIHVLDRTFCTLRESYHGLWCLPQSVLKETMRGDFVRLSDSRETAASYPMWELEKTPAIELDGDQVSRTSFVYHVSNSYAPCPTSPHGKIKVAEIFL